MKKFFEKVLMWWYFHMENPVIRKGEHGGFKWEFRGFWLDISTVSGNFKARYMADDHPYAYLLAGDTDDNIIGFCQLIYTLGRTLTTDQGLVNDVEKAINKYGRRIESGIKIKDDETEEKIALETEKKIQEHIELPEKKRKKVEKESDKRFKKAVKRASAQKLEGE